jgi:choline dehydrogenase-like flavoprotein
MHADVLIIGAGASGGVAARHLAASGYSVVCLEQGHWTDPASYPGANPLWEVLASQRWSSSPAIRRNRADYPIDLQASDLGALNFNGVGGGTILYNAQWPRMRPDDFRVASLDGVADDWPLTYDDLRPFYEETEKQFGVSCLGGNPAYPDGAEPPMPAMPIGDVGLRVARAHAALGWHWWPAANAINSTGYAGRRPCVQRGACGQGCNEGAKGSADVTHWPDALANGASLITGARVQRIAVGTNGLAAGAVWVDVDGCEQFQSADVVLCAANAIGTARLLLASACDSHPDGLANSSGLVGRRLMLHPLSTVVGVFDDDLHGWKAHNGALIQSLEFSASKATRGFVRGSTWGLGSATGPMRSLFTPDPMGVWGERHHEHVRSRFGHVAQWAILCEDLPEPHNRVVLDPDHRDSSGMPGALIEYTLSENSRRMMTYMVERAAESLTAAGASSIESTTGIPNGHFMGTARMGDDPATSVVDRFGFCHDVANLGIIDGSIFVTGGSANPTSTIAALALRTAEHVASGRVRLSGRAADAVISPSLRAETGDRSELSMSAPTPAVAFTERFLGEDPRRVFAGVADILIPADETMPAPSTVNIAQHLDAVLSARPDLVETIELVTAMKGTPVQILDSLSRTGTDDLRRLRWCVAAAYYLAPEVRSALGWDPENAAEVHVDRIPQFMEEGLLDHMFKD